MLARVEERALASFLEIENQIAVILPVKEITKLTLSYCTTTLLQFENYLYTCNWRNGGRTLSLRDLEEGGLLSQEWLSRIPMENRLLHHQMVRILAVDRDHLMRCHRFHCYYRSHLRCECGEPLHPEIAIKVTWNVI